MQDPIRLGWNLFHQGDFFGAHDHWEEAWQLMSGDRRVFWQAMIQLAVSVYHIHNENVNGAISQARKAKEKFQSVATLSGREDVQSLVSLTGEWLMVLERYSKTETNAFCETRLLTIPETILTI